MKSGPKDSIIVNVGRAALIDEEALYNALKERTIFAAGLDVWYNYPSNVKARQSTPASRFPYHELTNVVMSPHRAGHTSDKEILRMEHLAELLLAAARGEPLPNRVNLEAGY